MSSSIGREGGPDKSQEEEGEERLQSPQGRCTGRDGKEGVRERLVGGRGEDGKDDVRQGSCREWHL